MRQRRSAPWVMTVAGVALLAMPGCSAKWLSGGGESGVDGASRSAAEGNGGAVEGPGGSSRSAGMTADGSLPSLSADGSPGSAVDGGPLRGFERLAPGQTPTEERLRDGAILSRMMPGDAADKRMAELRREEEAAIAAGLKDAFFGYDQYSIVAETRDSLSLDADWIKEHPKAVVKISGHCDERGTHDYNLVLGDKRAKSVKRYLLDLGVSPNQVTTISFGKNRPFCAEHDEACHRQNRRGHFLLSQ